MEFIISLTCSSYLQSYDHPRDGACGEFSIAINLIFHPTILSQRRLRVHDALEFKSRNLSFFETNEVIDLKRCASASKCVCLSKVYHSTTSRMLHSLFPLLRYDTAEHEAVLLSSTRSLQKYPKSALWILLIPIYARILIPPTGADITQHLPRSILVPR